MDDAIVGGTATKPRASRDGPARVSRPGTGVMTGNVDRHVADWLSGAGTISPILQGCIACTDPHRGSGNDCPTLVR